VKQFFNVPLSTVGRCEKQVSVIPDNQRQNQNYYNANQVQNFIEIHTKDARVLKFLFTQAQSQLCAQVHAKIDRACFVDTGGHMQLSQFQNTFPYVHKLDVNDQNWESYRDGWSLYTNIVKEARR